MKITVTFRNTEGEEWFKNYVEDKLGKLKKYLDRPVEVRVVLSVEKFRNVAEINLTNNGMIVNTREEAKEMALAIDEAVEKIERQLKKHREKMRIHKGSGVKTGEGGLVRDKEGELEDFGTTRFVETRKVVLTPMSHDDAIMELESSNNLFIIFRDTATEKVAVVYRRDDGNYVLVETNS
ncbi:MAG TPA: ribosome-associated translation inhibitor RaiA [Syntrophales bacterium]|jgi:putative sigma-54 modulation protein|nr:ribosome-associated translation inhibitor RaiA [Syntrophales bacterium]HON23418.1 ribosome-associated translation inhibitor RaiA [Syntrophales bacterium]HOU77005.1 ribosome-associated translation inhibitor RaiA [Syntrophales bacterium]HPC32285.1 ribosome-associated translation inhibitor RaiA [Syntrophales bacterium]HQG34027.1 ribosome-associated translation inhibitor RaiA [Syntrophales bacterium]